VLGVQASRHQGLVEKQAGGVVHGPGIAAGEAKVLLGSGDEESAALKDSMPAGEVKVARCMR